VRENSNVAKGNTDCDITPWNSKDEVKALNQSYTGDIKPRNALTALIRPDSILNPETMGNLSVPVFEPRNGYDSDAGSDSSCITTDVSSDDEDDDRFTSQIDAINSFVEHAPLYAINEDSEADYESDASGNRVAASARDGKLFVTGPGLNPEGLNSFGTRVRLRQLTSFNDTARIIEVQVKPDAQVPSAPGKMPPNQMSSEKIAQMVARHDAMNAEFRRKEIEEFYI
jgi:hypothetical protein